MKRALVYLAAFATLTVVGCTERTEVRVEDKTTPDTVVVPQQDKDVNVNVTTENQTPVVEKETTTSTTIDNNNGTTQTEVKTETSN